MSFLPHKKFTWADFWGGYIPISPRRYAPEMFQHLLTVIYSLTVIETETEIQIISLTETKTETEVFSKTETKYKRKSERTKLNSN